MRAMIIFTGLKKEFQISDFEKIYISYTQDSEITCIGFYFFLILIKYFNFSLSQITDCFGKPLVSKVIINENHFYLSLLLFCFFFLKIIFRKILRKLYFNKQEDHSHFPKFDDIWKFILYISYSYVMNSLFGYPGFYNMLNIK